MNYKIDTPENNDVWIEEFQKKFKGVKLKTPPPMSAHDVRMWEFRSRFQGYIQSCGGIGFFDKKVLLGDLKWLKDKLQKYCPELKINQKEIERYIEYDLLPKCYREDGTLGFPIYTPSRIEFINKTIKKWEYDIKKLKQITDFENGLIDKLIKYNVLKIGLSSLFDYFIMLLKMEIESNKKHLEYIVDEKKIQNDIKRYKDKISQDIFKKFRSEDYRQQFRDKIKIKEDHLKFFKEKKFKDLPNRLKDEIKKVVSGVCLTIMDDEGLIYNYRAKILSGFSPNVSFDKTTTSTNPDCSPIKSFHVTEVWRTSSGNDSTHSQEFSYIYNIGNVIWYFSDWKCYGNPIISEYIDFFATPEFLIDYDDKKHIRLIIRDSEKVDSKYMRRIEKVYKAFRDNLNPKKTRWGEKSGIKERLEQRNKMLRKMFKELRTKNPLASAEMQLDKALQAIGSEYGEISPERAKRIIYTKKEKKNMS